jgi:hypothetical protein
LVNAIEKLPATSAGSLLHPTITNAQTIKRLRATMRR